MAGKVVLLLGGARSGKSHLAEALAAGKERVTYIATAEMTDGEMEERIMEHRRRRPSHWRTVEVGEGLSKAVGLHGSKSDIIIIDCLTIYAARRLEDTGDEMSVLKEAVDLCERCRETEAIVVLISNEVGWGIVPANRLARRYRDILGKFNQIVASSADEVYLLVAGIPIDIKSLAKRELFSLLGTTEGEEASCEVSGEETD